MFAGLKLSRAVHVWLGLLMVAGLTGCAHTPRVAQVSEVRALQVALTSLAPTVRENEAERVAGCAYHYSQDLALQYRVVRPAFFHNVLVNLRFKQRGLCHEWAEDLLAQLQTFGLQSLELRWGIARADTIREHNSVVVTARGQPFGQGIVLDPWRHCGELVWSTVAVDKYPWVEGELMPAPLAVTP